MKNTNLMQILFKIYFYNKKEQYFNLSLSSLCFKDYITQILPIMIYKLLKPHPEASPWSPTLKLCSALPFIASDVAEILGQIKSSAQSCQLFSHIIIIVTIIIICCNPNFNLVKSALTWTFRYSPHRREITRR